MSQLYKHRLGAITSKPELEIARMLYHLKRKFYGKHFDMQLVHILDELNKHGTVKINFEHENENDKCIYLGTSNTNTEPIATKCI